MKVKIFQAQGERYLEEEINAFLKAHENIEVTDIKFNVSWAGNRTDTIRNSAMIIYYEE